MKNRMQDLDFEQNVARLIKYRSMNLPEGRHRDFGRW